MKSNHSNPEYELLLAVARSGNKLNELISDHQIDWNYLLDLASHQGMLPLLHLGLKENKQDGIPTKVTDYLKNFYSENTQNNILLLSKFVLLLKLLDDAGIKAVPFKGVLLSKDLYNSYTLRQAGDIDILVKPKDVPPIIEILQSQGYELEYPFSRNQQIALAKISREKRINMINHQMRLAFEIHWRTYSRELVGKPETEFIWQNLEKIRIQNIAVKTFKPEIMLMYLCFHAFKHNWFRLFYLWEINQFIKKNQNLDWGWILKNSRNFGSENILFLSLLVVNNVFSTEIPHIIQDQITDNHHIQELFSQIEIKPNRFDLEATKKIDFLSLKDMFRIHSRVIDRANQFLRLAITPTHFDIIAFDFPPTLHFLYFLLRPVRLFYKAVRQNFVTTK